MTTADDLAPGIEFAYPLSDYAREAARALGPGWHAEAGFLGAWGLIVTDDDRLVVRLFVDNVGDLLLVQTNTSVAWPEEHKVSVKELPTPPRSRKELRLWGEAIAACLRHAFG